MAHYEAEGKALASTKANVEAHIKPTLGKFDLEKLNTKKIADWHRNLATSAARIRTAKAAKTQKTRPLDHDADAKRSRRATANRILTILKAALNYAWKEGKVASDIAWRKVTPFKNVDAPVVRYLTEAQCKRLVNTCPVDFRMLVQAALFTGCRYGELVSLKVRDFNPDAENLHIRTSKSGKGRHVVLTDEAKRFFNQVITSKENDDLVFTHKSGEEWKRSHQQRPLTEACTEACDRVKIKPAVSFHILRHTHGSFLAAKGVSMPVIAKQLGHADTRMTERHYAHLSPSYVADTIRENFPKLGIITPTNVMPLKRKFA